MCFCAEGNLETIAIQSAETLILNNFHDIAQHWLLSSFPATVKYERRQWKIIERDQ
jgi:hypothetical protein